MNLLKKALSFLENIKIPVVFNPVCQYGYTVFEGCYHIFCTFAVPKMRKK